jgi:hypothetical protein
MKRIALKSVMLSAILVLFSCDEPITVVTNYVHSDGSVTRRIEMRSSKNKFKISDLQVPFDNTWTIKDTLIVGLKKDTTWIKTAEKLFRNVDEINLSYKADSGANKGISRKAAFVKKFRWFNTIYRYSENIEKTMRYGYPVSDFLNKEELNYFYSPQTINDEKLKGADSLKYKAIADSVKNKTDRWSEKCVFSEWVGEFCDLIKARGGSERLRDTLNLKESEFVELLKKNESKLDSLWKEGVILKEMIGEKNAKEFRSEADSAVNLMAKSVFPDFKDYSVKIIMPGKVIGTNGFIDETDHLLWPVKSDYFIAAPYEMWAESRIVNKWAWIVTGIFLIFVITGLVIRIVSKREG